MTGRVFPIRRPSLADHCCSGQCNQGRTCPLTVQHMPPGWADEHACEIDPVEQRPSPSDRRALRALLCFWALFWIAVVACLVAVRCLP
jgi:hypothetical protein